MKGTTKATVMHRILIAIAALFGVVTIVAGARVLWGADPGFVVFRPLLIYNTTMGLAYLAVSVVLWRDLGWGSFCSGAIFLLNLVVLVGIVAIYLGGGAVAVDSLRAMTLRTSVWLAITVSAAWLARRRSSA